MIIWTFEPSTLGPSYEILRVRCELHDWSWASHEHGVAADAAKYHEMFFHR
jgi:hypothetical protein